MGKVCCCCDMRQGVMVSNGVLIGINITFMILGIIFAAIGGNTSKECHEFCTGVRISDSDWDVEEKCGGQADKMFIRNLDDDECGPDYNRTCGGPIPDSDPCKMYEYQQSDAAAAMNLWGLVVFIFTTFIFSPIGIFGAMKYKKGLVLADACWIAFMILNDLVTSAMGFARAAGWNAPMLFIIIGVISLLIRDLLYGWLLYGVFSLYKMLSSGAMTRENYAAQKKACCGASASVQVQPGQPQVIQAAIVQPTQARVIGTIGPDPTQATVVQAAVVSPAPQNPVIQASVVQANVVPATVIQASVVKS